MIYTSGSTGRPKGVLVSHRAAVRLFTGTRERFGFGPGDVWTLFHSFAFDFSVWEIWGALLHGGRLEVVPRDVARSPWDFHALLTREGVTVLNQTPSAFLQLLPHLEADPPPALRTVIFGGEALEPRRLGSWLEERSGAPVAVNMYGITETTVHVTWRDLGPADLEGGVGSPVGRPLPDLSVHLLDRYGNPVPIGVPGEIHVGGAGLARGYHRRPDLTAERFVPAPWGRLYRSGDLARWRPDGELEFLGRADQQVKVRGVRIEPGEIEAALAAHPEVREAVVIPSEDGAGGTRLVAYVVPRPETAPTAGSLRAFLAGRLPDAMVPSAFVLLDAFPLTAHGKLDRRALPEPDGAPGSSPGEGGFVEPRDAVERLLASGWAEALGIQRVGVHDGFFDLGGHSLLAVQVIAWVNETFEVEVPLRELFDDPTVAGLAAVLRRDPAQREKAERIAELMLDLAEMSDDEIRSELAGGAALPVPGGEE